MVVMSLAVRGLSVGLWRWMGRGDRGGLMSSVEGGGICFRYQGRLWGMGWVDL